MTRKQWVGVRLLVAVFAFVITLLLLTGCHAPVNPAQVERLVRGCADFGGVKSMRVQSDLKSKPLIAECAQRGMVLKTPYEDL